MRTYFIEKIGRGIASGYSENLLDIAQEFDGIIDKYVGEGWTVIDKDLRLGVDLSSVVMKRKDEGSMVSIVGYQIKSVEV